MEAALRIQHILTPRLVKAEGHFMMRRVQGAEARPKRHGRRKRGPDGTAKA